MVKISVSNLASSDVLMLKDLALVRLIIAYETKIMHMIKNIKVNN